MLQFTAATFPQFTLISGQQLLEGGLKLLFLGFFLLYLIFALMVIRQVKLMTHTISAPSDGALAAVSWLYFAAAAIVLILAIFAL